MEATTIDQTSGLLPRFYMNEFVDEEASKREGRPVSRQEEWVDITFVGNPVKTILPKRVDDQIRDRWATEYRAWKEGIEPTEAGTPLGEWPGIARSQAEQLVNAGIRTVEALASVPESVVEQFQMGRTLQNKARAYLEAASGNGRLSEQMAALQEQMADLRQGLASRDSQIAELDAGVKARDTQIAQLMESTPKKRGRPAKTED